MSDKIGVSKVRRKEEDGWNEYGPEDAKGVDSQGNKRYVDAEDEG